jgi:hypothetical protein
MPNSRTSIPLTVRLSPSIAAAEPVNDDCAWRGEASKPSEIRPAAMRTSELPFEAISGDIHSKKLPVY